MPKKDEWNAMAATVIQDRVLPAYRGFLAFLRKRA